MIICQTFGWHLLVEAKTKKYVIFDLSPTIRNSTIHPSKKIKIRYLNNSTNASQTESTKIAYQNIARAVPKSFNFTCKLKRTGGLNINLVWTRSSVRGRSFSQIRRKLFHFAAIFLFWKRTLFSNCLFNTFWSHWSFFIKNSRLWCIFLYLSFFIAINKLSVFLIHSNAANLNVLIESNRNDIEFTFRLCLKN